MNEKLIYISGPMEAKPNMNIDGFTEMEKILFTMQHYIPVNPHNLPVKKEFQKMENPTRQDYYRKDIESLCNCHEIVMLKDWNISHGAQFERYIAQELGITVRYFDELEFDIDVGGYVFK